jgi:hypothetical protein
MAWHECSVQAVQWSADCEVGTRSIKIANIGNDATKIATREAAQGRIDQIEIFERELAHLRADRVIHLTDSQVTAIAAYHRHIIHELTARYDADASDSGRQLSMSMRIVSVISAFLLGSSVFVFFYHFWAAFNIATQTFLLCAAPTSTFVFALVVRARDRTGYFSRLSAALCYASFVLAVVILPPLWNINLGSAFVHRVRRHQAFSGFETRRACGLRQRPFGRYGPGHGAPSFDDRSCHWRDALASVTGAALF